MASWGPSSGGSAALETQAPVALDNCLGDEATQRRIVQMRDWQYAVFPDAEASRSNYHPPLWAETTSGDIKFGRHQPGHPSIGSPPAPAQAFFRGRSFSVTAGRPPVTYAEANTSSMPQPDPLGLKKSRSHESGGGVGSRTGPLKRMLRRASVSLKTGVKGFMSRRNSISGSDAHPSDKHQQSQSPTEESSQSAARPRPRTSYNTWRRLRVATSFHRHSRMLYTGYGERTFDHNLSPVHSPTFPVPGSGDQPPIIPRSTGAAARHAAACSGMKGFDLLDGPPSPWPRGVPMGDSESGIGIALSSSTEAFAPEGDVDSDADVSGAFGRGGTKIVKVDFISQLPVELAILVLAELDAAALATASLVSKRWAHVVANQHVWRESFIREKTTTYATGGLVTPGAGLGVPYIHPEDDWKEIYRVKEELDQRWKEGRAKPVYLLGHTDSIYCLQFDEDKIITGSRDRTIRVWDLKTFACKLVLGPPEVVRDLSFSLCYAEDGTPVHCAVLPNVEPQEPTEGQPRLPHRSYHSIPSLQSPAIHHNASILCLQYDKEILVTGSSDSTCIVYDIQANYRPIRRLKHHSAAILDLCFDDKHIITCSKDISICVWDRKTGALLKQLRGHAGPVNAVQMRGNTIVSCSGDFRVKLWNIDTGKCIREFLGHNKGLACSQFSEDGRYIASAGNDKVIRIWDANTGECVREMKAHDNLVRSLHVDSISGRLISASYDSDIKVWDMETGQPLLDFPKWHNSWVLSAKSDYRRIISSGQEPKILVLDFGADIKGVELLESKRKGFWRYPDGSYI